MYTIYDSKEMIWSNPTPRPLNDMKITHSQLILDRLFSHGSRVAQINADNGHEMTFHEIRLETIRVAQNLQKRGFESHQVACFMAGNSEHLISLFLASICLANPVVPLHPTLSKDEIVRVLEKTKPALVFCDVSAYNEIKNALTELKSDVHVFTIGGLIDGIEPIENLLLETCEENNFSPVNYKIDSDVALITCSSGTTGPSKCACLSYSHTFFLPDVIDSNSVIFTDESIYWTVAIKPIIDSIHNGAKRLITTQTFSPELQLKLIEQYKINIINISTSSLILCLKNEMIEKSDLSSVKIIHFYGSKWPSSLGLTLKHYFPNANCDSWYGTTEIGRVSVSNTDDNGNLTGYRLFQNRQAKVIDESGNRCGPKMNGEMCFKIKSEFLGYLDDVKTTTAAIDNESFFHTGDVGYFDENGTFFIEDRKKNVLNSFYFDDVILPSEIEDFLVAVPDIKEACVVGIPVATGEALPAAVIVKKLSSILSAHTIYRLIEESFPNRSRLRGGIYFVDSLPKTHNGKLIRKTITDMANELFRAAKNTDPHIQSYIQEIPEQFRKMI